MTRPSTRVSTTDDAWAAEIAQVAADTHTYDDQAVEAAENAQDLEADARRDVNDAINAATAACAVTSAELALEELGTIDIEDWGAQTVAAGHLMLNTTYEQDADFIKDAAADYQGEVDTVSDDKAA